MIDNLTINIEMKKEEKAKQHRLRGRSHEVGGAKRGGNREE